MDRRANVDLGELGDRIAAIQDEVRHTTTELIDRRAWTGQIRRTTFKQRQALMGYHSLDDLPKDMERQAILERLGWRFIRIRGSAFFRDPESTMQAVFKRLDELGVIAEGFDRPVVPADDDTISAMKQRAAVIRAEWEKQEEPEKDVPDPSLNLTTSRSNRRDNLANDDKRSRFRPRTVTPIYAQPSLFPEEKTIVPEQLSANISSPAGAVGEAFKRAVEHDGEIPAKATARKSILVGLDDREQLLSNLDRQLHPAKWNDEPHSTRKAWMESCRAALLSCDCSTPESVFETLAFSDRKNTKGKLGKSIKIVICEWHSEVSSREINGHNGTDRSALG